MMLVVGDSQVQYLDRTLCEKEWDKRIRVCLLGAGVVSITDGLNRTVTGTDKDVVVMIHVGVNDIGRRWSEDLVKH